MSLENMKKFIFDIEIYPNYFCVVIKEFEKNNIFVLDSSNFHSKKNEIFELLKNSLLISYAGNSFDDKVLNYLFTFKNINKISMKEIHNNIKNINKNILVPTTKRFFSFDIYREYDCTVGIKGFSFNIGEAIVEPKENFEFPVDRKKTQTIIDYCTNDVLVTEKLFIHMIKNRDLISEKENIIKKILRKEKIDNSELFKYLKYTINELIVIFLTKNNNKNFKKKNSPSYLKYNKYDNIKTYFDNVKSSKVCIFELENTYFYKIIKKLYEVKKLRLKVLNYEKITSLDEKYLSDIFEIITTSEVSVLKKTDALYFKKIKTIFLKKIDLFIERNSAKLLKFNKNKIFIEFSDNNEKLSSIIASYFNLLGIDFNIIFPQKFLRLNDHKKNFIYEYDNQLYFSKKFNYDITINPKDHKWLAEVLRLHYLEKLDIKKAIKDIYKNNPDYFFMYYTASSQVFKCSEKGKLLNLKTLSSGKKYRVYYSKTGVFKPIDFKKLSSDDTESLKYKSNFAFGELNSPYYKLKTFDDNLEKFLDYDDFDLESYYLYAKEYIKNDENKDLDVGD